MPKNEIRGPFKSTPPLIPYFVTPSANSWMQLMIRAVQSTTQPQMLRVSFVTVSPQSYRESTCLHSFHKIKEEPPRRPLLILDTRSLLKGNPMNGNGGIRIVTFPHGVQHSQDNPVGARYTTWADPYLDRGKEESALFRVVDGSARPNVSRVTADNPSKGRRLDRYRREVKPMRQNRNHTKEKKEIVNLQSVSSSRYR